MSKLAIQPIIESVIQLGDKASKKGWTEATGGNFSARIDAHNFAISRSSVYKGEMKANDILVQSIVAPPVPNSSAETGIHLALYKNAPNVQAVVHVHSPSGILASLAAVKSGASFYTLKGYELLKAISGITTHETTLNIPVFHNSQNIPLIAEQLTAYLQTQHLTGENIAPCFLLVGHGLTVWGKSADEAFRHAEALEFLFSINLERRRLSI